ncbi:hypothetical protein CTI12_AA005110 [Artemisia annua]|uniref:RNA polymerase II subunit B1 CTD phosphatase RPAP2 homolog n=1 Tax=Artemisia annua TaxID=35608 RepID=A0A2U1QNP1_ARTAN|nr:hypothetical protein CTI12_AA005110 [Artemisia annua]
MSKTPPPVPVKDVVHKIQLCMLDGIESETQLFLAGSVLSKSDYNDVVTERSIAQMCGYPLCPNSLPSNPNKAEKGGRYRISLKEHKVYDLLETRMYCSTKCTVDSRTYAESLQDERSMDLDIAKINKVYDAFSLKTAGDGLGGHDFGLGKLSIKEKADTNVVSMEEWIGPSNAIEGYVPKHVSKPAGSKFKDSKLKKEEQKIFNEMDFMSTIIMQDDGYSVSKQPFEPAKKSPGTTSESSRKKMTRKGTNDKSALSADSSRNTLNVPETKLKNINNEGSDTSANHEANGVDADVTEREKAPICDHQPSSSRLKSSLKSSGSIKTSRSVSWADEKSDENAKEISVVGSEILSGSIDDDDHAFRLASAEACAEALKQAAEAVASGEFDAPDAVSEAGLVILPPPHDDNEVVSEGTVDPEPAPVKWPKKTGIVEADFLDSEDSWFDSPPEEFVVDLSPFGTMFMSLFAWVSSSTLAYVYGRDDSFHEDYASVNGREYPRKIVLTDGRSSEIKQTLAGCLSRALPGLIRDLRLPTPVSTIEFGLGSLIETMSFLDALPGLRMKQWKVFVLLFIEGLSVSRIPAIAPHLTNKRSFFQKVFDDGQISREEYELLKDLILPLGRAPQLATQSGG